MHKVASKDLWCNEELLLQEFNNYNPSAFEHVFKANYKALSYFALELTGCMMTAEDVVQSVFIRLWKNRNRFESISSLKSFLYVSVRNGSLDEKKEWQYHRRQIKTISGTGNLSQRRSWPAFWMLRHLEYYTTQYSTCPLSAEK